MTKEEMQSALQEIGTCEDEATRRELITQLSESVGADYDAHATTAATAEKLQSDNEELRSANMKLFLRVTEPQKPEPQKPEPVQKSYEQLFNE